MADAATNTLLRDSRILGLIGTGHGLSHFYQLCFPALILVWREEFGVSYAALGAVMTLFSLGGGIAQVPAGMLVDRVGARPVLVGGLALTGCAIAGMSLAPDLWLLYLLAAAAGIGNSVFHPADYAILNASVDPARMGKAFSLHTFSGNLGGAIAPAAMAFLIALEDWRFAVTVTGGLALLVALLMLTQGHILQQRDRADKRAKDGAGGGDGAGRMLGLFVSKRMLLFVAFFLFGSLAGGGITSFSVVANSDLHQVDLATASTALTTYLFATALGILLGGVAADAAGKHEKVAVGAFLFSATCFAVLGAVMVPGAVLIAVFAVVGLVQGMVRPARDMMLRSFAPEGTTGRVFAFASTGIFIGSAIAPVFFGLLIDAGFAPWFYWLLALFSLFSVAIVLGQARMGRAARAPAE